MQACAIYYDGWENKAILFDNVPNNMEKSEQVNTIKEKVKEMFPEGDLTAIIFGHGLSHEITEN